MSTRRLVIWITFFAIFAMAARVSMDTDSWWHLRAGHWIVTNGALPQSDPFSYTRAGQPWQYPGWLVEVPMYAIFSVFGPGGLNLWTAGMVTLAFIFTWRTLRGGVFLRAFILVLAAAASGVYWAARPYLVTFVFVAVFLWIFEEYRWNPNETARRRLWWLPVLMVLWANSHGGFAVGFIIWGVYLVAASLSQIYYTLTRKKHWTFLDPMKALIWTGIGMVLAVCINPYGPVMLLYPFKTAGIQSLQAYIQEWQSPDFQSLQVQPFIWLLLLLLAVVGLSRRRLAFTDFVLAAGFAYMGFLAGRNIALFGLVAPIVITRHFDPVVTWLSQRTGYKPASLSRVPVQQGWLNRVLFVLILGAVLLKVSLVYPLRTNEVAFARGLPVGAVNYLKIHTPPGRLFNSYNWGGYLLWNLPEYPVFIDGRTDLYDDELVNEWLSVVRGQDGWNLILDNYHINLILIELDRPLVRELRENSSWSLLYEDSVSVLFEGSLTP